MLISQRSLCRWTLALTLSGLACSGGGGPNDAGPDEAAPVLTLSRVGAGELSAHTNDVITLRVQLTQEPGGIPVPNTRVEWTLDEVPGAVELSTGAMTDANGVAEATLRLNAGDVRLHATSQGAETNAFWRIAVTSYVCQLRALANPPSVTVPDPVHEDVANVTGAVDGQVDFTVQVTCDTGPDGAQEPVANELVTWSFVASNQGVGFEGNQRAILTSPSGVASVTVNLGVAGAFKVLATISGNVSAVFQVAVQ